jgi:3-isopropylmalate/(R)-2-methylmalate dehydratase small subunit
MMICGRAHIVGDNISADHIISAKHFTKAATIAELKPWAFESLQPDFYTRVMPGDIVVAGHNFGSGSSREHAVQLLKEMRIGCVVARSFGRNFFRNSVNLGLPPIELDWRLIKEGDNLSIDLDSGILTNHNRNLVGRFNGLPRPMTAILAAGGLLRYFMTHKCLPGTEQRKNDTFLAPQVAREAAVPNRKQTVNRLSSKQISHEG